MCMHIKWYRPRETVSRYLLINLCILLGDPTGTCRSIFKDSSTSMIQGLDVVRFLESASQANLTIFVSWALMAKCHQPTFLQAAPWRIHTIP